MSLENCLFISVACPLVLFVCTIICCNCPHVVLKTQLCTESFSNFGTAAQNLQGCVDSPAWRHIAMWVRCMRVHGLIPWISKMWHVTVLWHMTDKLHHVLLACCLFVRIFLHRLVSILPNYFQLSIVTWAVFSLCKCSRLWQIAKLSDIRKECGGLYFKIQSWSTTQG